MRWFEMALHSRASRRLAPTAGPPAGWRLSSAAKVKPHPFLIANRLARGSCVSLQSALVYYGLIPEVVPPVTGVTTTRPGRRETPLGAFEFRHIRPALFWPIPQARSRNFCRSSAGVAASSPVYRVPG